MAEFLPAGLLSRQSTVQGRAFWMWEEAERGSAEKGAGGSVVGTMGVREERTF